ncbi:MAG: hypothetical protein ACI9S6_001471, partial [Reinekea sp.]
MLVDSFKVVKLLILKEKLKITVDSVSGISMIRSIKTN